MADLTYESVLELFAENNRRTNELISQSNQNMSQNVLQTLAKVTAELGKQNAQNSKKIGELGDTLGRFAEDQVKADLVNKFDEWGIPVHAFTTHFVQRNNKNEFVYEVDMLIYNTEFVIAIEVKNQLRKDDIDEHIERMKKLQEYPLPDTKGKKLLAGIASMIIGEGLEKYAESKGLFFIKPSGDTIKIANKKGFKPREWKVDL